jgi:hypothetical protein
MMASNRIKLTEIAEPKFVIEFADGTTRSLDPWETMEKLEKGGAGLGTEPDASGFDVVRAAFGFPTTAEREKAVSDGQADAPPLITRHACVEIRSSLYVFISELPAVKKISGLLLK